MYHSWRQEKYTSINKPSLNDLMDEVVEEISITTQNYQIVITSCPPVSVHGAQERIGRVLNNFLSNAVKYLPRGKNIELSCSEIDGWVQVSVKDEGKGINASDIDKLFDRFYRVDNPNSQNISGFGIGLYLCLEIIQRHNGKIRVESEPGKGQHSISVCPLFNTYRCNLKNNLKSQIVAHLM